MMEWWSLLVGWLTLLVLTATGGVITWYTVETYKLRREAQRQTELQVRPFLTLGYDANERRLYLRNIGRGVARDVRVRELRLSEEGTAHPISVQWGAIDYIAPDGQRELTGQPIQDGVEVPDSEGAWRSNFGRHGRRAYEFVVQYDDLAGNGYEARIKMDKGVATVLSDGRRDDAHRRHQGRHLRPGRSGKSMGSG